MWGPKVAFRPRADGSFVIGNGYRGAGPDYDLTIDSLNHLRHFLPAYRRNWRQLRLSSDPRASIVCAPASDATRRPPCRSRA